jgi:predicted alpha/beta-hydrolase family hydrolase
MPEPLRVDVTPSEQVTAIVYPAAARGDAGISLILAHGAGANQRSGFMVQFAGALAARGIETITFNFLYSETGRRLPDRNDKLEACWHSIIAAFRSGTLGGTSERRKLAIGGKSMGGRIASQVAAADPGAIAGLALLGYPLHPPGRPDQLRSKHLAAIRAPMLFVQGSRDAFGTPDELTPILATLAAPARLCVVEGGDHSFKVAKKAARSRDQVYEFILDEIERWLRALR